MEVAGQQREWQKEEEEEERGVVEEETGLQGRRSRNLATVATAIDVSWDEFQQESQQEEIDYAPVDEFQLQEEEEEESEKKNVYYDQHQGTESISGYLVTDSTGVRGSASENFFGDDGLVATTTKDDSKRDDNFSGFVLQPSEKLSEEHETKKSLTDITESCDEIQLIKEIDNKLTEFDVETVLEKQDTHDLYCPNCNSCITRRVILRKRKRQIRIYGDDPKRNKLETVLSSELDGISAHETIAADISINGSVEPAADDSGHTRAPEFFGCLSCFSIFIPSDKGFTLFPIFGDKGEKKIMQSPQPISEVKKNWLLSIFASRKEERLIEQGNGGKAYVEENIVVASEQGPKLLGEPIAGEIIKNGAEGAAFANLGFDKVHQLDSSSPLNEMLWKNGSDRTPVQTEEPAENVLVKPPQGGLKIPVHSSTEPSTLEKSVKGDNLNLAVKTNTAGADVEDPKLLNPVPVLGGLDITEKVNISPEFPAEKGQNIGANLPISSSHVESRNVEINISETQYHSKASQHSINSTKVDIHIEDTFNSDKGAIGPSAKEDSLLQDTQINIVKDTAKGSASTDTIITIKGPVEPTRSQEEPDIITSPETVPLLRPESAVARESRGVEIIKSMVYGGLIESITSLGIVSSAAGADASTLNILALALANLVGGLFVIGHNLWDLKDDTVETSEQVTTQKDRYQELLGRRENFLLHATVAVLSFLIFGLIPPVVYAFSFRVSDNVDYKLIAVAGAALLCITILATGKVYVQRPPTNAYVKTIIYYIVMGFMASVLGRRHHWGKLGDPINGHGSSESSIVAETWRNASALNVDDCAFGVEATVFPTAP
ncbi:hypothetical protein Vadar_008055 [Vaccinium darrowii]|uniref:Uncharacterized protein n=1 Tax=Vaccinium darrowii TaxID=229202 RepID=A0ACB7YL68_9ERIC|nr:hypothetical protein Vadar_008055 [Vaccinium darrowii]